MSHDVRRISPALAGAATVLLVCSAGAGAAVPRAGTFTGASAQGNLPLTLEVSNRRQARVASAQLHFTAKCEDGSAITRDVDLGRARVTRSGRFKMTSTSGGNFSAHGRIAVFVTLRGRFHAPDTAKGTFRAAALVTRDEFAPSVACGTGRVSWTASR